VGYVKHYFIFCFMLMSKLVSSIKGRTSFEIKVGRSQDAEGSICTQSKGSRLTGDRSCLHAESVRNLYSSNKE
jgi:hypothetical protein